MIGRLHGSLAEIQASYLIIDVQGVGYVVHVPQNIINSFHLDQAVTLHIHTAVREDAITLYGFSSVSDKQLFELLVSVSGVGPKLGLAVLSTYSANQIQTAVATGNIAAFSAVSGIGKKNAERIILELRNKVAVSQLTPDMTPSSGNTDLSQALASLGYSGAEVINVASAIDSNLSLEEQIKQSLRLLSK